MFKRRELDKQGQMQYPTQLQVRISEEMNVGTESWLNRREEKASSGETIHICTRRIMQGSSEPISQGHTQIWGLPAADRHGTAGRRGSSMCDFWMSLGWMSSSALDRGSMRVPGLFPLSGPPPESMIRSARASPGPLNCETQGDETCP